MQQIVIIRQTVFVLRTSRTDGHSRSIFLYNFLNSRDAVLGLKNKKNKKLEIISKMEHLASVVSSN